MQMKLFGHNDQHNERRGNGVKALTSKPFQVQSLDVAASHCVLLEKALVDLTK